MKKPLFGAALQIFKIIYVAPFQHVLLPITREWWKTKSEQYISHDEVRSRLDLGGALILCNKDLFSDTSPPINVTQSTIYRATEVKQDMRVIFGFLLKSCPQDVFNPNFSLIHLGAKLRNLLRFFVRVGVGIYVSLLPL